MMCGLMPYYLVSPISQTIQIERGILQAVAVGSVMAGSILNAGIRLILPTLADRAGRITCIQGVLFVAMIAMLFLISGNNRLITMAIILAYGCFGGIMGSFPSLSSVGFWASICRTELWNHHVRDHHRNDHLAGHIEYDTDP